MADPIELKSADHAVTEYDLREDKGHRDDQVLKRLGKNPVLKRNFGFITMLAFSSSVMLTWEGEIVTMQISLNNGGYAGAIFGFLVIWIGSTSVFLTMAELSSMAATAAGQYHWVAILAPKSCRVFLSFIIGWLTFVGWQALQASNGFIAAQMTEGIAVLNGSSWTAQPWQTMLLYWATLAFAIFINTVIARLLPKLEGFIMLIHVLGFIAILVPMLYLGPHGDPSTVFLSLSNGGAWPTQGLSFMIGLTGPMYSLLGVDSAIHMSEEIENPTKNVPRAIWLGVLINGTMGFGLLIAILFCIGNNSLDDILSTPTGYPYMAIFREAVGSQAGAVAMTSILVIMSWCSCVSAAASTSRMTWSFARDNGLPGSRYLKSVEPQTTLPLWSICLTAVISILLSLIVLGSSVAFNDVVSLTVSALYGSYLVGNTLLLWRRVTGQIGPYDPATTSLVNTIGSDALTWGPWRLPEPLGTINNAFGSVYMFVMVFFTFWPTKNSPDAAEMNYSSLMVGAVVMFACAYYAVWGRRTYTGPIVETNKPGDETPPSTKA